MTPRLPSGAWLRVVCIVAALPVDQYVFGIVIAHVLQRAEIDLCERFHCLSEVCAAEIHPFALRRPAPCKALRQLRCQRLFDARKIRTERIFVRSRAVRELVQRPDQIEPGFRHPAKPRLCPACGGNRYIGTGAERAAREGDICIGLRCISAHALGHAVDLRADRPVHDGPAPACTVQRAFIGGEILPQCPQWLRRRSAPAHSPLHICRRDPLSA